MEKRAATGEEKGENGARDAEEGDRRAGGDDELTVATRSEADAADGRPCCWRSCGRADGACAAAGSWCRGWRMVRTSSSSTNECSLHRK